MLETPWDNAPNSEGEYKSRRLFLLTHTMKTSEPVDRKEGVSPISGLNLLLCPRYILVLALLTLALLLSPTSLVAMHFKSCVTTLLVTLGLTTAASVVDADFQARVKAGLRLIKTSPTDQGAWVTDEEKINNYTGKCAHFVDITDIKDQDVLRAYSDQADNTRVAAAARITYPAVSHQTEANGLIAQLNTSGPQTWLKTLSE